MRVVAYLFCFFTLTLFFSTSVDAQRIATASIKVGEIVLDGTLNEISWTNAKIATGLTQYSPNPGNASSQKT